jgi:ABC-type sulfate/molybdate transport systems ATPase subunit
VSVIDASFVLNRRSFAVAAEFSLAEGERLALFGPSGAGKTTCLEAIAGTASLAEGSVRVDGRLVNVARKRSRRHRPGQPAEARDRGIAFVRQPTTLFPHLSVAANVAYGLRPKMAADRVESLLSSVELGGLSTAMPEALSGGQRQRACLARALGRPFRALLLDEPFSAVDVPGRSRLRRLVIDTCSAARATAIFVSHDLSEAQAFAHSLAVIDEGRVMQVGNVDTIVRQPASVRVAELFGYRGFLPRDDRTMWALHPDRFVDGAAPDRGVVLDGIVRGIRPDGARYACEFEVSRGLVSGEALAVVEVHLDRPPRPGDPWQVTAVEPPVVARTV